MNKSISYSHKKHLLALIKCKETIRILCYKILINPDNSNTETANQYKALYESNFSVDGFVKFYNLRNGTNFTVEEIEKLLLLV